MLVCWNGENVELVYVLGLKFYLVISLFLVEGLVVVGFGIDYVDFGDELSILLMGGVIYDFKFIYLFVW